MESTDSTDNLTVSFSSSEYAARKYNMNVVVYSSGFFRTEISRGRVKFDITERLTGQMRVNGRALTSHDDGDDVTLKNTALVSTKNETVATVTLHDPLGWALRYTFYLIT